MYNTLNKYDEQMCITFVLFFIYIHTKKSEGKRRHHEGFGGMRGMMNSLYFFKTKTV